MTDFSFGGSTGGTGGFTFDAGTSFSLGGDTNSSSTGFSFGDTTTTGGASTGFDFGTTTTDTSSSGKRNASGTDSASKKNRSNASTTATSSSSSSSSSSSTGFDFGGGGGGFSLDSSSAIAAPTFSLTDSKATSSDPLGSFSFGDSSSSSGASGSASTSAATSSSLSLTDDAKSKPQDPSSRLKNLTVEEIINLWNSDLDDHIRSFFDQALEIKKWDEQLIQNAEKICKLDELVMDVQKQQKSLNNKLDMIKTNQEELYNTILQLEEGLSTAQSSRPTPDEMKRAEAYDMAEEVDGRLTQMTESLKDTIEKLNKTSDRQVDTTNPFAQLVKILNYQLASLQWVEQSSSDIEKKVREAHSQLSKSELRRRQY